MTDSGTNTAFTTTNNINNINNHQQHQHQRKLSRQEFELSAHYLAHKSSTIEPTSLWSVREIMGPENGIYLVKIVYRWLDPNRLTLFSAVKNECTTTPTSPDELVEMGLSLYKFEYHILYSSSYQVPVLYFNICDRDGSAVSVEWLWRRLPEQMIARSLPDHNQKQPQSSQSHWFVDTDHLYAEFGRMITQTMHPMSGTPFLMVHPCHTGEMMGQLMCCDQCQSEQPPVANSNSVYLITWLSLLSNVVGLSMPLDYARPDSSGSPSI